MSKAECAKATFDVEQLTISEKLRVMECLWDDLCRSAEMASPPWHEDVLAKRESDLAAGESEILDWEVAKAKMKS